MLYRVGGWLDWLTIAVILSFAVAGLARGFLLGALDLASMVVSAAVALAGFGPLTEAVLRVVQVPRGFAALGAFLGLLILTQLVYSFVVRFVLRALRPLFFVLMPFGCVNQVLGLVPGAVKGVLTVVLLLLPFTMYPIAPPLSAAIEQSSIASRLLSSALSRVGDFEALLGPQAAEGLSLLSPPQTEEGIKLDFGAVGDLAPDPQAEQQMFQLVNRERQKAGVPPLTFDDRLRDVARAHSLEMFQKGYFSHDSPTAGSPFDRLRAAGIRFVTAGENLAYAPSVEIAHDGLMNSPGHRANILNPAFGRIGVGAIHSSLRGVMFSQEFTN